MLSAVPMAVVPFLSTAAVYEVFVREPLFSGKNLIIPCFQKGFAFCAQRNARGAFSLGRTVVLNCCGLAKPQFVK